MDMPSMTSEFLAQKSITDIRIFNDEVWFRSERPCDTCSNLSTSSARPLISQLSRLKGSDFRFDESQELKIPVADIRGNLYTATKTEILKINDIKNYTAVLKTGDFVINKFVFDKNDHIWISGSKGIAHWDGAKITFYNTSTSKITSDITHGIAVDQSGTIWVPMDIGKGLLKIPEGKMERMEIIPYNQISSDIDNFYLINPQVDKENRVWFTVFNSPTSSNVVCFDGNSWITEFPDILPDGKLFVDSQGTIWRLNHIIGTSSIMKFTLQYLNGTNWIDYDVSDIKHLILSLDADLQNLYLGTSNGLVVKGR